MRRVATACVLSCLTLFAGPFVAPAAAQQDLADVPTTLTAAATTAAQAQSGTAFAVVPQPKRPAALMGLYASYALLQVGDVVTTMSATKNGGVEANPLMKGIASNGGAMMAVKAGAGLGTIYLTEKLWKKNKAAAIASMVILNGAYAAIVANNARIAAK